MYLDREYGGRIVQTTSSELALLDDDIALAVQKAEQLPDITKKQMAFVMAYAQGATGADAYRTAYNVGVNTSLSTIWVNAAQIKENAKVKRWLAALREAGCEKGQITLQNHVAELERLKNFAISVGNAPAAVRAEELRGKCAGHYVTNHIHQHDMSLDGLVTNVGNMFGEQFKLVAMEKLGIKDITPAQIDDGDEYDDCSDLF